MVLRSIGVRLGRTASQAPAAQQLLARPWWPRYSSTTPHDPPEATWEATAAEISPWQAKIAEFAALSPQSRHEATRTKSESLAKVGSTVHRGFDARSLLTNPPTVHDATIEALMASQTHMGHNAAVWNPDNSRYIYGVRNGIHIISLEQTAAHLRRAAKVVEDVAYRAGIILFVGTRKGQRRIVTNAAALSGACHLFTKWAPGTITNREIMLRHKEMKIVDEKDRTLDGFRRHIADRGTLTPDLVVCMNPIENYTLLYECALATIPTIGIIDTDADPTWVTYAIPANDDSLRSVAFITGVLGQAAKEGRDKRLKAAQDGVVTWETPVHVSDFIQTTVNRRQQILDELDERLTDGKRAESFSKTDEDEAKALGPRQDEVDAAKEDALLVEELKSLAGEFGWDGSSPPTTDAEREFLAAEKEYEQLTGTKSILREDAEDERRVREVSEAINASGDVVPPKVPEKDLDEVTKRAEEAVLTASLGESFLSGKKDEMDRNEKIMKQVNVEKGLGNQGAPQNEASSAPNTEAREASKEGKDGRPKGDSPKE